MDDFKTQKISDYCRRRNFETFQKIDLSEKTFFFENAKFIIENNIKYYDYTERKKVFLNKTVDFFLFRKKVFPHNLKTGIKSFLYSKKLLNNCDFYFETFNLEIVKVSKKENLIKFKFQKEKYKIINDIETIVDFFITKNIVINKIFCKHKNKIIFTIYDSKIGLSNFNSIEMECYNQQLKGLVSNHENYNTCFNMKFSEIIPYKSISYDNKKYFDQNIIPYYIDQDFLDKNKEENYIINKYNGNYNYNHKVLWNNVIITSAITDRNFKISNYEKIFSGIFFISKNQQYIYIYKYTKSIRCEKYYEETYFHNIYYNINSKFNKIVKYDRKNNKILDFFNPSMELHKISLKLKSGGIFISNFHISNNELFLCIESSDIIILFFRNSIDENFILVKQYNNKSNIFSMDSNDKYFVCFSVEIEIIDSKEVNEYGEFKQVEKYTPFFELFDVKNYKNSKKITFKDEINNPGGYHRLKDYMIPTIILDNNKIRLIYNKMIYEFYIGNKINVKNQIIQDDYDDTKIIKEKLTDYDDTKYLDKMETYYVLANIDIFKDTFQDENEKIQNIDFGNITSIEKIAEEYLEEIKNIDENIIKIKEKIINRKNEIITERYKAFQKNKFLENKKFMENKIYLEKTINICNFLGIDIHSNILISKKISNNKNMILLCFETKNIIKKIGNYFIEYEYRSKNNYFFLIDIFYNCYFLNPDFNKIIGCNSERDKFTLDFSFDDNGILFFQDDEIYNYDISHINKGGLIKNTLLHFDNLMKDNFLFDRNLIRLIYES